MNLDSVSLRGVCAISANGVIGAVISFNIFSTSIGSKREVDPLSRGNLASRSAYALIRLPELLLVDGTLLCTGGAALESEPWPPR